MTLACPRCGLAFETRVTTNTRCRWCMTVVRIGPRPEDQLRKTAAPARSVISTVHSGYSPAHRLANRAWREVMLSDGEHRASRTWP